MKKVDYKYSEDKILSELKTYIDATYGEHYSKNKAPKDLKLSGKEGVSLASQIIQKFGARL